ncbi:glycan biosynthesis hexose transferase WsfD [Paenibacillus marinisediminis]
MLRERIVPAISILTGVMILSVILLLPPYIGMADNGDFARILSSGGISVLNDSFSYEEKYFGYAYSQYEYAPFGIDYASSQAIVIFTAGLLARLWNRNLFDMHVLGTIYSFLLLLVLYLFVGAVGRKRPWLQITLAASILFVFFDIGYTAYFQSFYGEPVSLLSLLMATACAILLAIRKKPSLWLLAAFLISSWMLTTSKLQNAVIGLAFAVYLVRLYTKYNHDRRWKRMIIGGVTGLLLSSALMYGFAPKELKDINLYQTIFYGILKDSPHPEHDLQELGLPTDYKVLAGTHYFMKDVPIKQDSPELTRDLYSRLGHSDVVKYYATHPARIVDKLQAAAKNAATIRPYYLGNYEKREGKQRGAMSFTYSTWSEGKKKWLPDTLLFYVVAYTIFGLLIGYEWRRGRVKRHILEIILLLIIISLLAIAIPLVGDGEADLGKHLFLFNATFDMLLISFAVWVVFAIRFKFFSKV